MVSGGRDSVCLLDVAVALRGSDVKALHVNYGLRPQAGEDERHCAQLCARLGVGLEIVRASPQERQPGNLQAWARELRYREAIRLAAELEQDGAPACVATGHTASDQVETILYRLAASPGRRALLGMAPREGRIVRPLLGVTREQTAAYCEARGLGGARIESNDSEQYARARVRTRAGAARSAPCTRRRRPTCAGPRRSCARRPSCWTAWCGRAGRAPAHSDRAPGKSCRPRWRAWWSCAWRRTRRERTSPRLEIAWRRSSRSAAAAEGQSCTWAVGRAR